MPSVNPGPAVQSTINYQDDTTQTIGVTNGLNAAAGFVGEYITATAAAAAVSLTSPTASNVTSIILTPGDWEVGGVVNYTPTGTTSITVLAQGASSATGALGAQDSFSLWATAANVVGVNIVTNLIPGVRFNVTVATTVFLVAKATFSASTLSAGGTIWALRIR